MERTLIVLKPDAVMRGIVGEVVSRFEKAGLKIIGMKMLRPSKDHYHHHYETIGKVESRRGKDVLDVTVDFMMDGPVIAVVLEGIEAVQVVRKMVGETEPKSAAPGTIRGDFTHMSFHYANNVSGSSVPNVIHASGDEAEAELEISHWFSEAELFDYETSNADQVRTKSKK